MQGSLTKFFDALPKQTSTTLPPLPITPILPTTPPVETVTAQVAVIAPPKRKGFFPVDEKPVVEPPIAAITEQPKKSLSAIEDTCDADEEGDGEEEEGEDEYESSGIDDGPVESEEEGEESDDDDEEEEGEEEECEEEGEEEDEEGEEEAGEEEEEAEEEFYEEEEEEMKILPFPPNERELDADGNVVNVRSKSKMCLNETIMYYALGKHNEIPKMSTDKQIREVALRELDERAKIGKDACKAIREGVNAKVMRTLATAAKLTRYTNRKKGMGPMLLKVAMIIVDQGDLSRISPEQEIELDSLLESRLRHISSEDIEFYAKHHPGKTEPPEREELLRENAIIRAQFRRKSIKKRFANIPVELVAQRNRRKLQASTLSHMHHSDAIKEEIRTVLKPSLHEDFIPVDDSPQNEIDDPWFDAAEQESDAYNTDGLSDSDEDAELRKEIVQESFSNIKKTNFQNIATNDDDDNDDDDDATAATEEDTALETYLRTMQQALPNLSRAQHIEMYRANNAAANSKKRPENLVSGAQKSAPRKNGAKKPRAR
jgi:hypothetical protein